MRDGCMDIYNTDAQTISNYTNKIVVNYVCYTQVLTNPSVCLIIF